MDDGGGFLTAERWEVPDVGFPTGFPKDDFFMKHDETSRQLNRIN